MTRNTHTRSAILKSIVMLASVGPAFAISNITIQDKAPDLNWFTGNGSTSAAGQSTPAPSYLINPNGVLEDNETEAVGSLKAIAGQTWDMEAFIRDGSKLYIVSGYDLLNGLNGGRPGDLFIKIGTEPSGNPLTSLPSTVQNGIANGVNYTSPYNYNFAVDLSLSAYDGSNTYTNTGAFGPTANVYSLSSTSLLQTVQYDGFRSNPWKYQNNTQSFTNTNAGLTTTAITYTTNKTTADLVTQFGAGYGFAGTFHNVLEIDLGFLVGQADPGEDVWFSYTMQCGNDSLKGNDDTGFDRVPDSTSSTLLIGFGFAAMALLRLKRREV